MFKDTIVICFSLYRIPSKSPPRFPNTAEFEIPLRRIKIYSMCVLILMLVRKKIDALAGLTLVLNIAPSNLLRIFKIRKSLATELKKNKNGKTGGNFNLTEKFITTNKHKKITRDK